MRRGTEAYISGQAERGTEAYEYGKAREGLGLRKGT
jgi:hypothetical protein